MDKSLFRPDGKPSKKLTLKLRATEVSRRSVSPKYFQLETALLTDRWHHPASAGRARSHEKSSALTPKGCPPVRQCANSRSSGLRPIQSFTKLRLFHRHLQYPRRPRWHHDCNLFTTCRMAGCRPSSDPLEPPVLKGFWVVAHTLPNEQPNPLACSTLLLGRCTRTTHSHMFVVSD